MNSLLLIMGTTALLGSALVGGIFYGFSSFVMKALERTPTAEGIAAMQSINIVVLNRSFLGAFIGTAVVSLGAGGLALVSWGEPWTPLLLSGALLYLVGTFLVTAFGNVPLNSELAAMPSTHPDAAKVWKRYLSRWTMWNHARTGAAMGAALLYTLGLLQSGI